ncbi:hypothetical protein R1sor_022195 [Riccia sorocarpa]|uniref:Uncharacterized protein n=1 Tax=Riccia sorocarpa TaxID=122646 RepID=A0ABD3GNE9_9MARC
MQLRLNTNSMDVRVPQLRPIKRDSLDRVKVSVDDGADGAAAGSDVGADYDAEFSELEGSGSGDELMTGLMVPLPGVMLVPITMQNFQNSKAVDPEMSWRRTTKAKHHSKSVLRKLKDAEEAHSWYLCFKVTQLDFFM